MLFKRNYMECVISHSVLMYQAQVSLRMRIQTIWVSDQNRHKPACTVIKQAREMELWIYEEDEQIYPSSKNKGAHELCSYCKAGLRLWIRICRLLVFRCGGTCAISCFVASAKQHSLSFATLIT